MVSPSNRNRLSQIAASRLGARLWRMNVGLSWTGKSEELPNGDVLIRNAKPIKSGVTGMSDGVGFVPVTITQEMVGQKFARYLAVEDKTGKGVATDEQKAFIKMVRSFGGLAGVARNDLDVDRIIRGEIVD